MKGLTLFIIIAIIIALIVLFYPRPAEGPSEVSNNSTTTTMTDQSITLQSIAFENNGNIPSKYTCDGENIIPPMSIEGVPEGAASLVLIMDDPDIPQSVKDSMGIEVFDHWVVWNIPPDTSSIEEGVEPEGVAGANSGGGTGYTGPCPPDGEHRYIFKLYALDTTLDLPQGSSKTEVEQAMGGHIISETQLIGLYARE